MEKMIISYPTAYHFINYTVTFYRKKDLKICLKNVTFRELTDRITRCNRLTRKPLLIFYILLSCL